MLLVVAFLWIATVVSLWAVLPPIHRVQDGRLPIFVAARVLPNSVSTVPQVFWVTRNPQQYVPGVVLVKTRRVLALEKSGRGFLSSALAQTLEPLHVRHIRQPFREYTTASLQSQDLFGLGKVYEVWYAAPVDPYDVCRALSDNPEIEYAEPMYRRYPLYTPNDPRFAQQWHLQRIAAPGAWDVTRGDTSVAIAVIDTGTDWEHEDLAANVWRNPREIPDNGRDDDGNG
ncbi:MAG: hypothetical protein NZ949_05395, partial [Candidatus Kapabacteria bacterium]|nr:hypothetical protein [Candidatus Kapabacteria bacterium]MDW7996420.1 hypothetical protein [Bacteroidota bacterium]